MIIGVTGTIGSGKSYVTRLFKEKGLPTVDADRIYHSLTNKRTELTEELEKEFGSAVINEDGSLNRPSLADIVFSDSDKLHRLNELTHKHVIEMITRRFYLNIAKGKPITVVEVPLMFESGFYKKCSEIVCVVANDKTRIKRLMKRNGFTEDEAKKRIKNQKNNDFYIENSTKIVYNETYGGARKDFERVYNEIMLSHGYDPDNPFPPLIDN